MTVKCNFCNGNCIKNGFQSNGIQRYKCSICKQRQQKDYLYNAYKPDINQNIIQLTKEGVSIRSTARILKISTTTLLKRIIAIAKQVQKPIIRYGKEYEVDELCTYIRNKRNFCWIVLALERESKRVMSFAVGKRTNKTLSHVLHTLQLSFAKRIFTDRLINYKYLIDDKLHTVKRFAPIMLKGLILRCGRNLKD